MNMRQTTGDRMASRPVQRTARYEEAAGPPGEAPSGRGRLLSWLAGRISSAGDRLFRADDKRAIASGWQITPGRSGLSRTYRDPRFDLLARCDPCHGSGKAADRHCARCAGAGGITLAACQLGQRERRRDR